MQDPTINQISSLLAVVDLEITALDQRISQLVPPNKSWKSLERQPWTLVSGALANSNQTGSIPVSTSAPAGLSFASRSNRPNGQSWADDMWYMKLGADDSLTRFRYSLSFMFPTAADVKGCWAKENDLQQVPAASPVKFDWGWQFAYGDKLFRVWNPTAESWESTNISLPAAIAGEWIDVSYDVHRENQYVFYDQVSINGTVFNIGMDFPAPQTNLPGMINVGDQSDGDKSGDPVTWLLDRVDLEAWQ